ncbi:MAG: secondary thiamine-phosphate synthase enzyme YjbQ [Muribaculaceae bacterium]
MFYQKEFALKARSRGCHLITGEVLGHIGELPRAGMLNLFLKHTSAALTINENADPDVTMDMAAVYDHLVRDGESYFRHTMEGDDDMSAHAKSSLTGVTLCIPITDGRLNMGIWQGIYLCEFRDYGGPRTIVATIIGADCT